MATNMFGVSMEQMMGQHPTSPVGGVPSEGMQNTVSPGAAQALKQMAGDGKLGSFSMENLMGIMFLMNSLKDFANYSKGEYEYE